MTTTPTTSLHIGDLVVLVDREATYYIGAVGVRLTIANVENPARIVFNVHPGHVTPTGETITLCDCLHDVERVALTGYCGAVGCGCTDHHEPNEEN